MQPLHVVSLQPAADEMCCQQDCSAAGRQPCVGGARAVSTLYLGQGPRQRRLWTSASPLPPLLRVCCAQAGHILGVKIPDSGSAKHVLSEVFRRIAQYKMGSLGLGQTLDSVGETPMPTGGDQFERFEL